MLNAFFGFLNQKKNPPEIFPLILKRIDEAVSAFGE
jgi:hypothetical protein